MAGGGAGGGRVRALGEGSGEIINAGWTLRAEDVEVLKHVIVAGLYGVAAAKPGDMGLAFVVALGVGEIGRAIGAKGSDVGRGEARKDERFRTILERFGKAEFGEVETVAAELGFQNAAGGAEAELADQGGRESDGIGENRGEGVALDLSLFPVERLRRGRLR